MAARARPAAHHGSPFGLPVLAANLASSNPDLDRPLFLVTGGHGARPAAHHGSPFGLPVLAANLASSNPDLDHPLFLVTGGRAS
ncbi:hypothetical protein, partial [Aeromonas caviae]|uniref:hypothetical protein n=2 Tax=Aeromonas caviae TaxID=648 RepID=UPI001CC67386